MKRKIALFLIASILTISFVFYGYQICFSPNILVNKSSRVVTFEEGISYPDFLKYLSREGYVNDLVSFSLIAKLHNLHKKSVSGRYALRSNMNNLEAVRIFRGKLQYPVDVTFSNARLIEEMGAIITKNISLTTKEFDKALDEYIADNKHGFDKENILCLFLPNTYEVYYNVTAKGLINRIEREYEKFWDDERRAAAAELNLSPIEASVLASIVQAETVNEREAPRIAGLYLNRLKRRILLQADPTVVFATKNFGLKRVLNEHKAVKSEYNTYANAGLPPGPINLPRLKIIDAVLHPEKHDYIFMCAKPDFSGYHNFSKSYEEHVKNAQAYRLALTIEQRKSKSYRK